MAKRILLYAEADSAGLLVTDEQILQNNEQNNQARADRIESGDENAKIEQERLEGFIKALNMTEEEYYNLIHKNILKEAMVMSNFAPYYYENIYPKNQLSIDDYLNDLLKKSDLKILMK